MEQPDFPASTRAALPTNGAAPVVAPPPLATPTETPSAEPAQTEARPLAEILADLAKPIPKRHLSTKTLKGSKITFCPWHRVVKILDHYTRGRWDYEVLDRQTLPTFERTKRNSGTVTTHTPFLITVRITIHGSDASTYRDGTGYEEMPVSGYGDVQSNAESMALRRAASKLGLGLHLYEGED